MCKVVEQWILFALIMKENLQEKHPASEQTKQSNLRYSGPLKDMIKNDILLYKRALIISNLMP